MYERTYGPKYDRNLNVVEIAKRVRSEIKALVKDGSLPADWKYTVRTDKFSGGSSIDVRGISPVPIYRCQPGYVFAGDTDRDIELPIRGEWKPCRIRANDRWWVSEKDALVPGVGWVRALLNGVLQAYNYNGSEIQVDYHDVKFYGHAEVTTAGSWPAEYEREISDFPSSVVA